MGAETKKLAQVSYVTDTDVSYYEIGEVEQTNQGLYLLNTSRL